MSKRKIPKFTALIRRNFFTGLLVVIPLGVISWIVAATLQSLWRLSILLPDAWQPDQLFQEAQAAFLIKLGFTLGLVLVLTLGVSLLGWASKQFLGKKLLKFIAEIIQHIPILRTIYSALDQLLSTFSASGAQQFHRVVYVEYPRKDSWALAFVTGPARGKGLPNGNFLNLYVPTTPNPTSGFHLIVDEKDVRDSQMRVEDAFKTIISLGIAQPNDSA